MTRFEESIRGKKTVDCKEVARLVSKKLLKNFIKKCSECSKVAFHFGTNTGSSIVQRSKPGTQS